MTRAVLVLVSLVVVACGGPDPTAVTSATNTTATSAPVITTAPSVEIRSPATFEVSECSSTPPVRFVVLCDSFEEVMEIHVDIPDPAALASAAALGVAAVEIGTEDAEPVTEFGCVTPHPTFEVMCEAIAARSLEGPIDLDALVTGAVQGMFRYGLDPFSSYIPGDVVESGFDPTGLVLELGIVAGARDAAGSACSPIGPSCRFEVISVFEFGAAASAGVVSDDVVVRVDAITVEGLSSAEALALLSGAPGTTASLEIDREGVSLVREMVREDVRLVPSEEGFLGNGIVYFRMNDFSQQAAVDLGAFLQLPEVEGASGMVLDLRDNPGGLVLAAQAVASQFLDGGLVMIERGRSFVEEVPVLEGGFAVSRPELVVLVNRASASAAEIVAAVLQERGRAIVIGEPTFGKNLVQLYDRSRDGGQVGITIARWETPGGADVGITGLEPDVPVVGDPATEADEVLESAIAALGG